MKELAITCIIELTSGENKLQPKIIGSKFGSPPGSEPRSGLARARLRLGTSYSALFGLGSAQGSRGWLTSGLDLGLGSYRLGLAQAG